MEKTQNDQNSKIKELSDNELKEVSGGLSYDKVNILDQKIQNYYRQGLITMDELLEVHNALYTCDDVAIHNCLYPKIDGPNGLWTNLYLEFSSYRD